MKMSTKFKIIDKTKWSRKEHFRFFSEDNGSPLYDITTYIDVTNFCNYVKRKRLSFYYSLIWVVTEVINKIEDFRYKIRGQDIIIFDRLIPGFTDLKPGSELFHIVVVDFKGGIEDFVYKAKKISSKQQDFFPTLLENYEPDMFIQFSCLPWLPFTSLNSEKSGNRDDSIPKITWGKYENIEGKIRLPVSIQVNHRLIDGFHLGKFFNLLQNYINDL